MTQLIDALARRQTAICLMLMVLLLFLRRPDAFLQPQFWAEDGTIFFRQQYLLGWQAIIQPYAGYLHLAPRLAAWLAAGVAGPELAPFLYNAFALGLTLFVGYSVFNERLVLPLKFALALSIVLVPHRAGEVFMTITNIQWILALYLITVFCRTEVWVNKKLGCKFRISEAIAVSLCGLTGPFGVMLTAIILFRVAATGRWVRRDLFLVLLATTLIQLVFMMQRSAAESADAFGLRQLMIIIGRRLFAGVFIPRGGDLVPPEILCVCVFVLLCFLLYAGRRYSLFTFLTLGLSVAVVAATLNKFGWDLNQLYSFSGGPRYFFIPTVAYAWVLLVSINHLQRIGKVLVGCLLTAMLATSALNGFRAAPLLDLHWYRYASLIGRQNVKIPINPIGWEIDLIARHSH